MGSKIRDLNWGKLSTKLVEAILIAFLCSMMNNVFAINGMKRDVRESKQVIGAMGKSLWQHLHPGEPCPWPDWSKGKWEE
jgi:hypothetical protein